MVQVLTVEFAVFSKQISYATGDLAADCDTSVSVFHVTTLHDNVFSGRVETAAVGVTSGFDSDAVVAGIEVTVFDQNISARLRIAAVVVWTMSAYLHILHDHVTAEHRMNLPHRGVLNLHTFDQHVLAAIRLNELRA